MTGMRLTIPNQLTLLRIFLTPLFLFLYLKDSTFNQLIATGIFSLAAITDWYDGWYARRFGVITRWGQFMDPLADKFLVSTALLVFAGLNYVKWWMVLVIVLRDVFVTLVRIYAIIKGTPLVTHLIAKWKTFLQMITIFIVLFYVNWMNFYGLGSSSYQAKYFDIIGIPMLIVTGLTIISAAIYIYENGRLVWRMVKEFITIPFMK
jgi:CDP-diacylglycerol--glycerol-3-phosphate 3-phosphatidyltransferase